jgi:hypothetical protein
MNNDNQFDRLLKVSLAVLNSCNINSPQDVIDLFPDSWPYEKCNMFLDQLLEYCARDDKQYWEQSAIIRDVKKTINETR